MNWDKKLDSTNGDANGCNSDRFTCIFPDATFPDGAAVRDNETGLVWERTPDTTLFPNWASAFGHCYKREVGGRKGWSLPTVEQLASLVDTSGQIPSLPAGHPFTLTGIPTLFWTATTDVEFPTLLAWVVSFQFGEVLTNDKIDNTGGNRVWCRRGGPVNSLGP